MGVREALLAGNLRSIDGWKMRRRRGQASVAYETCPSIDDLPFDSLEWPFGLDKLLVQILIRERSPSDYTVTVYESDADKGMLSAIYEESVNSLAEAMDLAEEIASAYEQDRRRVVTRPENNLTV